MDCYDLENTVQLAQSTRPEGKVNSTCGESQLNQWVESTRPAPQKTALSAMALGVLVELTLPTSRVDSADGQLTSGRVGKWAS